MNALRDKAKEAVFLLDRAQITATQGDPGRYADQAEQTLYELMGLALIFDTRGIKHIVELYLAAYLVNDTGTAEDTQIIKEAYHQLQVYADSVAED